MAHAVSNSIAKISGVKITSKLSVLDPLTLITSNVSKGAGVKPAVSITRSPSKVTLPVKSSTSYPEPGVAPSRSI